jgi:hypothetical protein
MNASLPAAGCSRHAFTRPISVIDHRWRLPSHARA